MSTQQEIDRLRGIAGGIASVIGSAVTLIAGFAQQIRDAADDPDEIRAIADELDAKRGELATSIAVNTPASDEVPADNGGTGDDSSNVDPDDVDVTEATTTGGTGTGTGNGEELED